MGLLASAAGVTGCSSSGSAGADRPARPAAITVTSPAFTDGGDLPDANTCVKGGARPPISWSGVPSGTGSIAVVVIDTSAPGTITHWYVVNLPATTTSLPPTGTMPAGSHTIVAWLPPCPAQGLRDVYEFTVYALPEGYEPARLGAAYAADAAGLAAHAIGVGSISGFGTRPLNS